MMKKKSSDTNLHIGLNIGGTNCSVVLAHVTLQKVVPVAHATFATTETQTPEETLERLLKQAEDTLTQNQYTKTHVASIGISCGGPLNSRTGEILSPPNLPGWDCFPIVNLVRQEFSCPVQLENDANASALAEWYWGAGHGLHSFVFLTFGTGMGAGLILNRQLYRGACDFAGEVGHIRLAKTGPVGFGKEGSFEGFCSGSGIAQVAQLKGFGCAMTAKSVFKQAHQGDSKCKEIVHEVGLRLGQGLALLLDILNPQAIILGGIFEHQQAVLEPQLRRILEQESLPQAYAACQILPAALGSRIGDYAALAASYQILDGVNL